LSLVVALLGAVLPEVIDQGEFRRYFRNHHDVSDTPGPITPEALVHE
jgi:hypothetical protein